MISISGRIPIRIFPLFWFLVIMIGWLNTTSLLGTAIWGVVIVISVLIHEYGHACTALMFGQKAEIHLEGMGGVTTRHGPRLARWKEFIIVLNGPLAGLLLFMLASQLVDFMGEKKTMLAYALQVTINVNLFWTLFNLFPILPLDGGHLLRILLESIWGVKGSRAALLISVVLGVILGLGFFVIQQILMGALVFMLAFESYRAWSDIRESSLEDENEHLQQVVQEGISELKNGHREEALSKFTFIRNQAPKGMLYVMSTQYGARILAEQGKFKQAYEWLSPIRNRVSADYIRLLQQIAYRIQEWEDAAKIGEQAYQQEPSMEVACINALSYAIMGNALPAIGWLRCALQLGLPDLHAIIEKREFDAIRHTDVFQNWLRKNDG